jgi:hypothetical protein
MNNQINNNMPNFNINQNNMNNQFNNNISNFNTNQNNMNEQFNNNMPNFNQIQNKMNNKFNNNISNFNINQNNMNEQFNNNMVNFNTNQSNMNNQINNDMPNFNMNQNNNIMSFRMYNNDISNFSETKDCFFLDPISLDTINLILYQMKNQKFFCKCKFSIVNENNIVSSDAMKCMGFFCSILYKSKKINVVIAE